MTILVLRLCWIMGTLGGKRARVGCAMLGTGLMQGHISLRESRDANMYHCTKLRNNGGVILQSNQRNVNVNVYIKYYLRKAEIESLLVR